MTDGERLREALGELKWSGARLARTVEVTPGTVYNWLHDVVRLPGAVKAYIRLLLKVRTALDQIGGLGDG